VCVPAWHRLVKLVVHLSVCQTHLWQGETFQWIAPQSYNAVHWIVKFNFVSWQKHVEQTEISTTSIPEAQSTSTDTLYKLFCITYCSSWWGQNATLNYHRQCHTLTVNIPTIWTLELWLLNIRTTWVTTKNFSDDLRPKSWVTTRMPVKATWVTTRMAFVSFSLSPDTRVCGPNSGQCIALYITFANCYQNGPEKS
jgi:hypothetical protein